MKCPRCGGDMSSGVCSECGFPETIIRNNSFFRLMIYFHKIGGLKNGTFWFREENEGTRGKS